MKVSRKPTGFTLVEIIAVLVIIGFVAAMILPRLSPSSRYDLMSSADVIRGHLFYAQGVAMKQGTVAGIKCDGTHYWLFRTNAPDAAANQLLLPGESAVKVLLSDKRTTLTAFTLFFDFAGRPYTAYTNAGVNSPVSPGNPLVIIVGVTTVPDTMSITITPETGFVQ